MDKPIMVFDWDKAARFIKERGAKTASAGLQSDWEFTGGPILVDGVPCMFSYTYLASTWAIPELMLEDDYEVIDCYIMQDQTSWGAETKWPQSALDILNQE